MKTVSIKKDDYSKNTVRVSVLENNATTEVKTRIYNELTKKVETKIELIPFENLLYCVRLEWNNNENELDVYINELKQYWEIQINSK